MEFANLFWQHPMGDTVNVPCRHIVQTGTTNIPVPTGITIASQHDHDVATDPFGVKHDVPCLHLSAQITTGMMSIPTYGPQHPVGDVSPVPAPCIHLLTPASVDAARNIIFYTADQGFQTLACNLVDQLKDRLHVRSLGMPTRPLLFFFRDPVHGDPEDNTDPFWNHYDPVLHAIQITRDPQGNYGSLSSDSYDSVRWHLPHELSHAIVGQSCVQAVSEGDPHSMKQPSHPGEAMSEGWANFVRIALTREGRGTPGDGLQDFEVRDKQVPRTKDIEYNVMCILWDLYDISWARSGPASGGRVSITLVKDDDAASAEATAFSFEELFGVFSPSLDTLPAGPIIWDIDNYLSRLKTLYPQRASVIDSVRALHLD